MSPPPATIAAMAYDEALADRLRDHLDDHPLFTEKKMFGGIGFMIGGHMAAGVHNDGRLMVRCSKADFDGLRAEPHGGCMERGGKPMSGWLLIDPGGFADDEGLAKWANVGRDYAGGLPPKKK